MTAFEVIGASYDCAGYVPALLDTWVTAALTLTWLTGALVGWAVARR
jgi:hypothetical protein